MLNATTGGFAPPSRIAPAVLNVPPSAAESFDDRFPQLLKVRETGRGVLFASPNPRVIRTCWLAPGEARAYRPAGFTSANGGGPVHHYTVTDFARRRLAAAGVIPALAGSEVRQ